MHISSYSWGTNKFYFCLKQESLPSRLQFSLPKLAVDEFFHTALIQENPFSKGGLPYWDYLADFFEDLPSAVYIINYSCINSFNLPQSLRNYYYCCCLLLLANKKLQNQGTELLSNGPKSDSNSSGGIKNWILGIQTPELMLLTTLLPLPIGGWYLVTPSVNGCWSPNLRLKCRWTSDILRVWF